MKEFIAALTFFTRLPLWKLCNLPAEAFKKIVPYWSFSGWLTGAVMALTFFITTYILPIPVAVILAMLSRLLLTGCLHEDGLADFCDGFGGGRNDRERILSIMKDSHIGTYGVAGLIVYFLLWTTAVSEMPTRLIPIILIAGDAWSKFCASQIINVLPYTRKESEAKIQTVYSRMDLRYMLISFAGGAIPLILLPVNLLPAIILPAITSSILFWMMKKRIDGYTGDCCGATFLLCELSFYIGILIILA